MGTSARSLGRAMGERFMPQDVGAAHLACDELVSWKGRNAEPAYRPVSGDTAMDIRSLSSGGIAVGSADPSVGVLNDGGGPVWQHLPEILDQATPAGRFNLSSDGGGVEFGFFTHDSSHGWHQHLGRFDLALRQASFDDASGSFFKSSENNWLGHQGLVQHRSSDS